MKESQEGSAPSQVRDRLQSLRQDCEKLIAAVSQLTLVDRVYLSDLLARGRPDVYLPAGQIDSKDSKPALFLAMEPVVDLTNALTLACSEFSQAELRGAPFDYPKKQLASNIAGLVYGEVGEVPRAGRAGTSTTAFADVLNIALGLAGAEEQGDAVSSANRRQRDLRPLTSWVAERLGRDEGFRRYIEGLLALFKRGASEQRKARSTRVKKIGAR